MELRLDVLDVVALTLADGKGPSLLDELSDRGATIFYTAAAGATGVMPQRLGAPVATSSYYDGGWGDMITFTAVAYHENMDDSDPVSDTEDLATSTPTGFDGTSAGATATRNVSYQVDPLNRQSVTDNGVTTGYTPNGMNQYTSVGGQSLGYDGNFNLVSYKRNNYASDAENRMYAAVTGSYAMSCVYDGLGRCLKRTINGAVTVLAYDGWKPIEEWDGAGNVQAWNIYGPGADEILYRQTTAGAFRYHHDKEGNVTFLLDGNGNGLERYTYDAFGGTTVTDWDGTNARDWSRYGNRFRFNGREYFAEMGIYDYRNRWYHPYLGRFLQVDPLGLQTMGAKLSPEQTAMFPKGQAPETFANSEINLFRYCGDDPMDKVDPLGLEDEYLQARVTAYGYGKDNKYPGHPNGGDAIAHTSDHSRFDGSTAHAVLGDGSFAHPSSMATNPTAGIALDSMVYVKGIGWFKVEDRSSKNLPKNTFDMWSGRSDSKQRSDLTGPRDVTVYGPKEVVPKEAQTQGAGPKWSFAPKGDTRAAADVTKPLPPEPIRK